VSEIPETRRPEVIRLVLQELGTPGAIAMAELAKISTAVQWHTGTAVAPGAQRSQSGGICCSAQDDGGAVIGDLAAAG
jgi:hypothetical protein